jgi:hypothetical protein
VSLRGPSWQQAYFSVSAILGESLDDALASLSVECAVRAVPEEEFLAGLRSPSREVRAQAIARGLSHVLLALDAARLV